MLMPGVMEPLLHSHRYEGKATLTICTLQQGYLKSIIVHLPLALMWCVYVCVDDHVCTYRSVNLI